MTTPSSSIQALCCVVSCLALMLSSCQPPEPVDLWPDTDMSASPDLVDSKDLSSPPGDLTSAVDLSTRMDLSMPNPTDMGPDLDDGDMTSERDLAEDAHMNMTLAHSYLYIGGGRYQGNGFVRRYRIDHEAARPLVDEQTILSVGDNLSYMAIDPARHLLHVIDETRPTVYSVPLTPETGLASSTHRQTDGRCHGVHMMLSPDGKHAIMSCYNEGKTSLLELDEASSSLQWRDTVDSGAKSHQAMRSPDGRYIFVVSLEANHIARYTITANKLESPAPAHTSVPGNIGPRHMTFHPSLSTAYILGELKPTLITARYNTQRGTLEELDSTSLEENDQTRETRGAAVRVHPSGKWLLGTQRFLDGREGRIVIVELDAQGKPVPSTMQHTSSLGLSPRDLAISGDGTLVAVSNRRSQQVVLFDFDVNTGQLQERQRIDTPDFAQTVLFHAVFEP